MKIKRIVTQYSCQIHVWIIIMTTTMYIATIVSPALNATKGKTLTRLLYSETYTHKLTFRRHNLISIDVLLSVTRRANSANGLNAKMNVEQVCMVASKMITSKYVQMLLFLAYILQTDVLRKFPEKNYFLIQQNTHPGPCYSLFIHFFNINQSLKKMYS